MRTGLGQFCDCLGVSSGVSSHVTNGSPANGDVEFLGLSSIGESLSLTLTDEVRQSGLAQLTLAATDIDDFDRIGVNAR